MTTTPTTDQLPGPGPVTDVQIAHKLGLVVDIFRLPEFSTDMNQALKLVRKLAEDDIKISIGSTLENTFEVSAWTWDDAGLDELELYSVIHENPAYAVCLVFLAVYRG